VVERGKVQKWFRSTAEVLKFFGLLGGLLGGLKVLPSQMTIIGFAFAALLWWVEVEIGADRASGGSLGVRGFEQERA
jgi:hypothetical protein